MRASRGFADVVSKSKESIREALNVSAMAIILTSARTRPGINFENELDLALTSNSRVRHMREYTIGEAAAALSVTTKALRHWESVGLLAPSRTATGYRMYTDGDLERGAAIALYRGVGIALEHIAPLIDAPSHTLHTALMHHRRELRARARALRRQLEAVEELIVEAEKGTIDMDAMRKYLGEKMPEYQDEARQRWGDTKEWAQSQVRMEQMGEEDFAQLQREQQAFAADLVAARDSDVTPGSEQASVLVERHRGMIGQWYEATPSRQLILARMYVADERFHEAYGGAQDYLLTLVEAHVQTEGVDVSNPQWD